MAILGQKATLEIGAAPTLVGSLTSIGAVEQTIGKVDVSTLDDDHKKNIPGGLIDTSDIGIEGLYVKAEAGQLAMATAFAGKTIETFTATYSDGAKWVIKGFITNLTAIGTAEVGDTPLAFAATIAPSEAPVYTAAV